ncbi:4Fe-4S ferredoxin [Methanocaldococcus villosus KIN24-T80]|uniref:4Fe-4S ferredoxin n=1 Tax=Methanocaldococcus villosus KIN24-T80 TaxID=1069083 RepID=N6W031_9EURY|nr:4Fe-4S binding protein [Methanocaldococcus villosus]ENN96712.1 4Fe-4S ferredoxin [Methanocaldococcus villosus KIN24-T80]
MPEHILSGVKAIVAMKLRRKGLTQEEIAELLKCNRSAISHYLTGKYPKEKVIRVARAIESLSPREGVKIIKNLIEDKELIKNLIKNLYDIEIYWDENKCLFCGSCLICEAISQEGMKIKIDKDKCWLCLKCLELCPANALILKRENYDSANKRVF